NATALPLSEQLANLVAQLADTQAQLLQVAAGRA
ncbi:hypothetical protein Pgy4_41799, partial [Pseudomonas savastanoi pv. glycinea str. race 4]